MSRDIYDVVVVGAGATGGWAAMALTAGGMRVLLLDAGPYAAVAPARAWARQPVQSTCYAYGDTTSGLFVDDVEQPYTTPPGRPFRWIRSRVVGGRALLWAGHCYRMSTLDFKAGSRDGLSDDWPIDEGDLRPYYARVERFLGVRGACDGVRHLPDGDLLPPAHMTAAQLHLKHALERRWPERRVIHARLAETTPRGSPPRTIAAAARTGRLTLRPNAVARRILVDAGTGLAHGLEIVDAVTSGVSEVRGRVIVLSASTIETTRLLLNSATRQHPAGLGNTSGSLGRYLMDHTCTVQLRGDAPGLTADPAREGHGVYIPCFRNLGAEGARFPRGYGVQAGFSPGQPGSAAFWLDAFGEVLPRFDNRVTVDPSVCDALGIPVAHVSCAYGEEEREMERDMLETLGEIADAAGFEIHERQGPWPPGHSIHEVGTARMGADPRRSVLDRWNRSWDVDNLFVTDGSCFVTSGCQNPTLTMLALTARACDHILELARRGEIQRATC